MRIRNASKQGDKIEIQMAPMIDVVFQLLIFFMLTLKIIEPEGDFNINMPLSSPVDANKTEDIIFPKIKVRMTANADGRLASLSLNQNNLGNDKRAFEQLNLDIFRFIGGMDDEQRSQVEVEIDADYNLHYSNIIRAVGACSGKMKSGRIVRYIEKIKFAAPRKPGDAGA